MRKRSRKTSLAGLYVKGGKTRAAIVSQALRIASAEGLAALTIGRLARELRMSKGGLFDHFGSKETLEVAVVERAGDVFFGRVLDPAEEVRGGIERVWMLCDRWLEFVEKQVLPGGYFFTGALFVGADPDGLISRRIREIIREWLKALREAVEGARRRGEIGIAVNVKRTAFELNSLLIGAQWSYRLEQRDFSRARKAILAKLRSLATEKIPARAFDSVMAWTHYLGTRSK